MSDYSSKAMVDSGLLDAKKKYNRINSEDYGYNDNQYDADMFDAINELNNAQSNYDAIMKKSRKAFIDLKRGKNNEK
ncbi:MAG: hypothetical protein MJ224_00190 [archaeon]|nr:hypothetical protein [archaeon]